MYDFDDTTHGHIFGTGFVGDAWLSVAELAKSKPGNIITAEIALSARAIDALAAEVRWGASAASKRKSPRNGGIGSAAWHWRCRRDERVR